MNNAGKVFAAVFVCFNAVFLAMFACMPGFEVMETGEAQTTVFARFCEIAVNALMFPAMLVWHALPERIASDALEWTLLLLLDVIYCTIITAILLLLTRPKMRLTRPKS